MIYIKKNSRLDLVATGGISVSQTHLVFIFLYCNFIELNIKLKIVLGSNEYFIVATCICVCIYMYVLKFFLFLNDVYVSIAAFVVMPSGKKAYPKIQDNKDGTVTIRYQPTETGLHELFVKYNNDDIEGKRAWTKHGKCKLQPSRLRWFIPLVKFSNNS